MTSLQPKAGFNWNMVAWSKPDSVRPDTCSRIDCLALIPEDSVPLMLWKEDGHAAQFCDACQRKWWGVRGLSVRPLTGDDIDGSPDQFTVHRDRTVVQMFEVRRRAGSLRTGAERDKGSIWHAVPAGRGRDKALCGVQPIIQWSGETGDAVTCPRCLRKIARGAR